MADAVRWYTHVVPKGSFFDRPEIQRRVEKMKLRAMRKFGAYVRTVAQRSLRYAKNKHSKPGEPPKVHTTANYSRLKINKKTGKAVRKALSPLRDLIFFSFDQSRDSVVIGPIGFKTKNRVPVPQLLEHGGEMMGLPKKRRLRGLASQAGKPVNVRVPVRLEPRPYMWPAAREQMPKFPELFRGGFGR